MATTTPLPFWMQQRQVKAEPINDTTVKLIAPQLPTYEIEIRPVSNTPDWHTSLYQSATEGSERKLIAETEFAEPGKWHAWDAGFELYRQAVVV